MSKLPLVIALGTGYVLGTRAGRPQYERMKAAATRISEQPFVRRSLDNATARATEFVRQQGEIVTDKVAQAVKDRLFSPAPAAPAKPVTVDDAEVRSV